MRPWRGGGRPGRRIAVLPARPRHSGKPGAQPVAPGLPGRRDRGDRKHRPARAGAHRAADGIEGHGMNAPEKNLTTFDAEKARADFEILSRTVYGKPLVYLDSGASAQKPRIVLDTMRDFAQSEYANVHRGVHFLSAAATDRYEAARRTVQKFLNAA